MHVYKLTSDHNIYFHGKSELLNSGDIFELAGKELSSIWSTSPFHYKGDIIRLPNAILQYCGPNPIPRQHYRNPQAPPMKPLKDCTKYIGTLEETKDDKDNSTLILLITIIILLGYIIYKLETYFKS
jgi:hypothetical protein